MWIDLRTENGFRVRNGQGLRICNYFYRMAYSLGIGIGRFSVGCSDSFIFEEKSCMYCMQCEVLALAFLL